MRFRLLAMMTLAISALAAAASQAQAPAPVPKTGQKYCVDAVGMQIPCAGTGQDGDLRPGVAWPEPRFTDNLDGTVTDNLTGLVWLRNANCFGELRWTSAVGIAHKKLQDGICGLADGSVRGDWRLPTIRELASLIDYNHGEPALSDTVGRQRWQEGDPFIHVKFDTYYWTSTSGPTASGTSSGIAFEISHAFAVNFKFGSATFVERSNNSTHYKMRVWPVRDAQ